MNYIEFYNLAYYYECGNDFKKLCLKNEIQLKHVEKQLNNIGTIFQMSFYLSFAS